MTAATSSTAGRGPTPEGVRAAHPRARRRVVLGWSAVGAATAYLYAVDPTSPGHYPICPTWLLTGTYCPGCGGLRAAHALLHGDVPASLGYNPALLPVLVLLAAWAVVWWRRGRPPVRVDASGWRFRVGLALVAVFWVARNVPGWDWLSPA